MKIRKEGYRIFRKKKIGVRRKIGGNMMTNTVKGYIGNVLYICTRI
jgi:hypothetical protein